MLKNSLDLASFVIAGLDPAIYPSTIKTGVSGNLMEAPTANMPYPEWRDAVDKRLLEIYCISIEDAGFDEEYLTSHWQSNEGPIEFVEWFGNKYDLDPRPLPVRPRKLSR